MFLIIISCAMSLQHLLITYLIILSISALLSHLLSFWYAFHTILLAYFYLWLSAPLHISSSLVPIQLCPMSDRLTNVEKPNRILEAWDSVSRHDVTTFRQLCHTSLFNYWLRQNVTRSSVQKQNSYLKYFNVNQYKPKSCCCKSCILSNKLHPLAPEITLITNNIVFGKRKMKQFSKMEGK